MTELFLFIENFFTLFMASSLWLLIGLLVAGVMHVLVPISLLQRHMGSSNLSAIAKSAVIGAPLPLCSCGVIPAAIALRRAGASKPATISFLVSTPETGVDSAAVSYALLGPLYAIARPVAAIFSAIFTGVVVKLFSGDQEKTNTKPTHHEHAKSASCCSKTESCSDVATSLAQNKSEPADSNSECCSSVQADIKVNNRDAVSTIKEIITYASGQLLADIAMWLLIGLTLAAAIQTWVPMNLLTQWGSGFIAMLVMASIGIPMYICATASTPIAVGFLASGVSPGAVLVFLLAGPATNVSTMGMIAKEMGRRTLYLYVISVMSISILLGYALNGIVKTFHLENLIRFEDILHQHAEFEAMYALSAIVLAFLMIRHGWQYVIRKFSKPTASKQSCCSGH